MTVLPRNPNKVPAWLNHPAIEVVRGQLSNREAVESAFAGKDAAILVALGWGNTAIDVLQADTLPSLYLFETAAELGVKHLIYTSSTVAYGEHRHMRSSLAEIARSVFSASAGQMARLGLKGTFRLTPFDTMTPTTREFLRLGHLP